MSEIIREKYAAALSAMIQKETVSEVGNDDRTKFREFHALLKELFPHIFAVAKFEDMDGSFLMCWKGKDSSALPVLFMNHHDTVEANGERATRLRVPSFGLFRAHPSACDAEDLAHGESAGADHHRLYHGGGFPAGRL